MKKRYPDYDIMIEQRLKMLKALENVELRASELNRKLPEMRITNIYYHLRVLAENGFVKREKRKRKILKKRPKKPIIVSYFSLTKKGMDALRYFR